MKIDHREPVNIYRKGCEEQPERKVRPRTIVKYTVLILIGILLFRAGHAQALLERGYEALGGEVFALFLPVFYWMVSRIVGDALDVRRGKKEVKYGSQETKAHDPAGKERKCADQEKAAGGWHTPA